MADRPSTLERLVFFSDAVFAIAITLLVLDLRLPPLDGNDDASLLRAIGEARPQIFAFLLSFFVVGAYWTGHLRTLGAIEATNQRLVAMNLAFLFFVVLLPFPTSIVAEHGDLALGAISYAVFGGLAGLMSTALWLYATRSGELAPGVTPELSMRVAVRGLVPPAVFLASIPIAVVSPYLAELSWAAILPIQIAVVHLLDIDEAIDSAYRAE